MIAEPPSDDGADHCNTTLPFPPDALDNDGAPGTEAGVADSSFESDPSPTPFTALTLYQYVVPFTALESVYVDTFPTVVSNVSVPLLVPRYTL